MRERGIQKVFQKLISVTGGPHEKPAEVERLNLEMIFQLLLLHAEKIKIYLKVFALAKNTFQID